MDFSNFKVIKKANERVAGSMSPREQSFKFKFKAFNSKDASGVIGVKTLFAISKKLFNSLDLSNKGLVQLETEDTTKVFLATVDNQYATMLKRTEKLAPSSEKQMKFKTSILEKACTVAGLIKPEAIGVNQNLDLVTVGENVVLEGITYYKVLEIVSDLTTEEIVDAEELTSEDDEAEDDNF